MDVWNYADRRTPDKLEMRQREMFIFFSETIATKDGMEIYSSATAANLFGLHKEKMIQFHSPSILQNSFLSGPNKVPVI